MSTPSEKVDRRTAARYEAVLRETATDLLARANRVDRHLLPPFIDRDAELMTTSPNPSERHSAGNVGEAIGSLARGAIFICRWIYERVAL
jgi:hypothetical protein